MKITNLDAVTKKVKEQLARKDSWIQDLNLRGSIVADGQLMENGLRPFKIP